MIRQIVLLAAVVCGLAFPASAQIVERKVALIVANSAYQNAQSLPNPMNDGRLIEQALKRAGFDSVTLAGDLGRANMERTLREFRTQATGSSIAVVYYAGHGVENEGKNWLIPTDATLSASDDLPYEAVDLERVMDTLKGAKVRMVVLDACRNNPFTRAWRSNQRGATRGLVGIEVDDYVVIYAAAPGQTAADGDIGNSPFALSLAARIDQPGLMLQNLGNYVRDDVLNRTAGRQRPFVSASMSGTPVYLYTPPEIEIDGRQIPRLEVAAWYGALGTNTRSAFEAYRLQYPKGNFIKLANQNIKRLLVAPAAPQPAITRNSGGAASDPTLLKASLPNVAVSYQPAAAVPQQDESKPTDPADDAIVARLNREVQAHNDGIAAQNQSARAQYQLELAAVDEKLRRDQEEYRKNLATFAAERERWRENVRACENKDVERCAKAANTGGPSKSAKVKLNPDQVLVWQEALVVCRPPADSGTTASQCEGPSAALPAVLGTAEGDRSILKACGPSRATNDLGIGSGMRIFGCGFGAHPEDPDGKRQGNLDIAAKYKLDAVAGRAVFHCSRKTAAICKTS